MTETDIEIIKGLISIIKTHKKFSYEDIVILKRIYHIVNSLEEPKRWITVKGNHIPIFAEQTPRQAIEKFFKGKSKTSKFNHKRYLNLEETGKGTNPNYEQGGGYKTNCQSCIVVFSGRLKGLKIKAKPFNYKTASEELKDFARYPNKAFINSNTGKHPEFVKIPVNSSYDCKQWLDRNINEYGIYAFGFYNIFGQKHIITVYKNTNSDIVFYDPQNNEYEDKKSLDYIYYEDLNKCPQIFRIDDKKIDMNLLNKISEPD